MRHPQIWREMCSQRARLEQERERDREREPERERETKIYLPGSKCKGAIKWLEHFNDNFGEFLDPSMD